MSVGNAIIVKNILLHERRFSHTLGPTDYDKAGFPVDFVHKTPFERCRNIRHILDMSVKQAVHKRLIFAKIKVFIGINKFLGKIVYRDKHTSSEDNICKAIEEIGFSCVRE